MNCGILDVIGVANVIVAFVITDVVGKDAEAVMGEPEEALAVVKDAVGVSEARVPVRLYAAAQAASDIPCMGLEEL